MLELSPQLDLGLKACEWPSSKPPNDLCQFLRAAVPFVRRAFDHKRWLRHFGPRFFLPKRSAFQPFRIWYPNPQPTNKKDERDHPILLGQSPIFEAISRVQVLLWCHVIHPARLRRRVTLSDHGHGGHGSHGSHAGRRPRFCGWFAFFHARHGLRKTSICLNIFPLLVLIGIYHYWKFPGFLTKWKKTMVETTRFLGCFF